MKVLLLLVVLFFAGSVHAAPSYTASPLVIDVDVQPRDIIKKQIILTNTGTQPVTIYPSVNNISLQEGGRIDAFLSSSESDKSRSLANWIEVSRRGIDLRAGESYTLDVLIRVTPSPAPGTYHAFIGFGYGSNRPEAEAMVAKGTAPGTIVTVNIEEKKNQFLKLSKFIVDRFVTSRENQAAVFTFVNPSEEALTPTGEIIFYNNRGIEVASVPVNESNTTIQPGKEHVFETKVPVDGLFGKYKAFLSVEYGTGQRAQVQDTSFFYIFPLKTLLIILGILFVIVVIFSWYVHMKYFDEAESFDHEELMLNIKDGVSDPKDHDIDLKNSKHDS